MLDERVGIFGVQSGVFHQVGDVVSERLGVEVQVLELLLQHPENHVVILVELLGHVVFVLLDNGVDD